MSVKGRGFIEIRQSIYMYDSILIELYSNHSSILAIANTKGADKAIYASAQPDQRFHCSLNYTEGWRQFPLFEIKE